MDLLNEERDTETNDLEIDRHLVFGLLIRGSALKSLVVFAFIGYSPSQ